MKKTLLIIAIVLCVAVAGAALAVEVQSDTVTGTLTADTYLALSLGGSETAAITLIDGAPVDYTIVCNVTKSTTALAGGKSCTLTITLTDDVDNGKNLDAVTVRVYDNANKGADDLVGTYTGADTYTITGITDTSTYYAVISLASGLDEDETEAVGGTMTLSFAKAF